jgi:hypothetical protein
MLFIGRSGDEVLFSSGELAVVVNEKRKLVSSVGSSEALVASFTLSGDQTAPNSVPFELAVAATTDLDIKVFSNSDRLYTVPKAVQAEAKRALEWHKKEHRGGTPVGMNTARTLAKGGQIGIQKVRHIAKYFPRHQVDKKGKGYEPGEPNYPSNGRIAWALWGGDAAERWASAIVDRENKKAQSNSITASYSHVMTGYESPGRIEFDAFIESETLPVESAPQFYIRIRLDSGKVDRVYKVIPDGACFVWDDGMWEDLGNINHDFAAYDRSLDDPYDRTVKMHVPVDVQTSIILCGMFDSNPFEPVSISQLAPDEAQLFVDQVSGVDWGLIDAVLFDNTDNYVSFDDFSGSSITAAGPETGDSVTLKSTVTNKDGNYTPEERSSKARGQVRNKNGEFAKAGGRVVIGGNAKYSGTVESANSDTQTLKIKLDNGNVVDVPGNTTEPADTFVPLPQAQSESSTKNITRNILGQPRAPIDSPVANVPNKLPQLRSNQVNTILADFSPWATDARTAKLTTSAAPTERSALIQQIMDSKTPNAYNDPSLRAFLEKSSKAPNGETLYPNAIWYRPDLRGIKPTDVEAAKPSSSLTPSPGKNPDSWLQQPAAGFAPTKPSSTTTPTKTPSSSSSSSTATPGVPSSGTGTAPTKGKYVNVPPTGYSTGGTTPTTIYPGESVDSINDKGEVGSVVQKFKDASGKETTEYKGADGSSWFGQKGTVVPKGFKLYEDGAIGPNDPKNPPPGSYDSSKTGPNGKPGKALETFTDKVDGRVRTKYSDGKSTWYGEKNTVVAPGFAMQEDGSWARTKKPVVSSALIAAAEVSKELTPDTSDVPPIYMAIVSPDDPQAVMDLVSLIPASTDSTKPMTFIRKPGKWEKNEQVLNDLNSPTPPPVVVLDDETLETVLEQVDSIKPMTSSGYEEMDMKIVSAMIAAGGLDKNKGNAEDLRQYWLHGKGAAKIRWGTGGDWTRCVRQLSKYMGPRAKGYCALRHKEATGLWTGDKEHKQLFGKKGKAKNAFSSDFVISSEAMIASATIRARAEDARMRVFGEQKTPEGQGANFFIPLVIPEGIESGDGRKFDAGAITIRELPLPFLWQIKTGEGHSGSVVVGTITKMERVENGIGNAYGHFDSGEYGKEAERLVRGGFIRGVSADLDMFEAKEHENAAKDDADGKVGAGKMKITKARVMAVTLVPKPAYQECKVELVDEMGIEQEEEVIQDGVYVEGVNPLDASALIACGMVAGAIPVTPPKEWFNNPGLKKPTALTVTDDGKVFGHIAAWHVDHIGMAFGTRPPRSKSNYAFFHTGVVRTDEGADMPVGQLTLAGGHAGLEASAQEAVRHYDDTASAVADVHAGEDAYGIWVSGALRPGTSPEQIRALRASAPSGDWRPIKGALELVAVCQVNVPGFPIARARVASGQVMALVAAGASVLAQLKHDPLAELHNRIDKLEAPLVAAATDARTRMQAMTAAIKAEELSSKVLAARNADSAYMLQMIDDSDSELSVVTRKERMKLAESKKALPDGSFPIRNANDLRNAIQAYGRSKPGKRGVVRRHIAKMARQLDKKELIPSSWKEASDSESMVASLRERIAIVESVVAAGGLDRNSGNAERLRHYWTRGEGAAKIRWGTSGDWKRCVKHLGKYMGVRAKGYCQLRHKDALGFYTSTHAKRDKNSKNLSEIQENISTFETQVSEADMAMDMEKIYQEEDGVFEPDFKPSDDIIIILNGGDTEEEEAMAVTAAADISEEDLKGLTDEELKLLKKEVKSKQKAEAKSGIYTPKTQPRDAHGKFRQVLARLKVDLGDSGSAEALKKIAEVENLDSTGDYAGAANSAADLLGVIDRLDTGALNADSLENVRNTAGQLGSVIANLPFAFGQDAQKIRFSDIPPALSDLMDKMITRVEAKIGKKDADIATKDLRGFMSGSDYYSQSEISSQMSKLLRLLT